ncbi:phage tail tube protein [Streptomyces sp. WMMC897]|uniref:phage tail tube protein n=1 Tax=Streptomyces sp. WMMC897 TaxID=3014782 RepID=UPI0022B7336B|nr:phage tail tube protein [Streptomyces sp. WMMC897]MCZ7414317.1 phage tail tube protein [Streptomyces sp. WMMC897]
MPGKDAFGVVLKRDSDGAGTFAAIANVSDLSGPERERESIEVTAHDSPDQYREFVKGLKDGGEVSATINYDPAESSHSALDDDFEEDDLRDYQIVILPGEADEHTWDFAALITSLGDAFPVDDRMEREVTFKISGKPTLTPTGV